jgi:hypothetical protein
LGVNRQPASTQGSADRNVLNDVQLALVSR